MTNFEMPISGERVTVREFRPGDVEDAFSIIGDDRVTRYLSFDSRDRAQAKLMIDGAISRASDAPRTEYYLAIAKLDEDQLIGFIRLALGGVKAAKLGYAIAADHWSHGYATDAVRIMLCLAFEELKLHRVTAAIGPENEASVTVVKKLGFVPEGRLRDHVFTNGAWRDSLLYSILADEWLRSQELRAGQGRSIADHCARIRRSTSKA